MDITQEQDTIQFGKHKGTAWTRLPQQYLFWMVNLEPVHSMAEKAQTEIDRRGIIQPEVDVTHHAIDRCSVRCLNLYLEDRNAEEGISTWLTRVGKIALDRGEEVIGSETYCYKDKMIVIISTKGNIPSVTTVWSN